MIETARKQLHNAHAFGCGLAVDEQRRCNMSQTAQVNEEISRRITMLIPSITLVLAAMSMGGPLA
jgi:hypothetical protein